MTILWESVSRVWCKRVLPGLRLWACADGDWLRQEVLIALWRRSHGGHAVDPADPLLPGLMFKIARDAVLRERRDHRRRPDAPQPDDVDLDMEAVPAPPSVDQVEARDLVAGLPPLERDLVKLREAGHSLRAAAKLLGCPLARCQRVLGKARARLAPVLEYRQGTGRARKTGILIHWPGLRELSRRRPPAPTPTLHPLAA